MAKLTEIRRLSSEDAMAFYELALYSAVFTLGVLCGIFLSRGIRMVS